MCFIFRAYVNPDHVCNLISNNQSAAFVRLNQKVIYDDREREQSVMNKRKQHSCSLLVSIGQILGNYFERKLIWNDVYTFFLLIDHFHLLVHHPQTKDDDNCRRVSSIGKS